MSDAHFEHWASEIIPNAVDVWRDGPIDWQSPLALSSMAWVSLESWRPQMNRLCAFLAASGASDHPFLRAFGPQAGVCDIDPSQALAVADLGKSLKLGEELCRPPRSSLAVMRSAGISVPPDLVDLVRDAVCACVKEVPGEDGAQIELNPSAAPEGYEVAVCSFDRRAVASSFIVAINVLCDAFRVKIALPRGTEGRRGAGRGRSVVEAGHDLALRDRISVSYLCSNPDALTQGMSAETVRRAMAMYRVALNMRLTANQFRRREAVWDTALHSAADSLAKRGANLAAQWVQSLAAVRPARAPIHRPPPARRLARL